jgi:lysozyme
MKKLIMALFLTSLCYGQVWVDLASSHIKKWEGFRPTPYKCQAGVWTIGYGFTDKDLVARGSMTEKDADSILRKKVLEMGLHLQRLAGDVKLEDNQLAALISLRYNIGRQAFINSTVLKKVRSKSFDDVPQAIAMWNKVKDPKTRKLVRSDGLVKRRVLEIKLWWGID